MRLLILSTFHNSALAMVVAGRTLYPISEAATVCFSCGTESANRALPVTAGDGRLNHEFYVRIASNATRGVVVSMAVTDQTGAAIWLQSLPASSEREFVEASYVWSFLESNPELVRRIIEDTPIQTEYNRGRGMPNISRYEATALHLIDSDLSPQADSVLDSGFASSAIPEPSVAILVGIGGFGLLRRRRSAAYHRSLSPFQQAAP